MCTGIILKDGRHLQSIREIADHFKVDLTEFLFDPESFDSDCCTCQMNLEKFMNHPDRIGKYEYDFLEYYEL